MKISLTEENYVKAIFKVQSANNGEGVSTNELSKHLNNTAASVTDMLKKLSDKKILQYQKYYGVSLTAKGEKIALEVIRKHRLWEVFLMEKLNFKWDEVHDIAEQLEHIKSDELIERLDSYLGRPKVDPHGDPIPNSKGLLQPLKSKTLSHFKSKGEFIFTGVTEHSKTFLQYLSSIGLKIGDILQVEEINSFDLTMQVKINKNKSAFFSDKVTSNILVEIRK